LVVSAADELVVGDDDNGDGDDDDGCCDDCVMPRDIRGMSLTAGDSSSTSGDD